MNKTEYTAIEAQMLDMMRDSAHDKYHVFRVLKTALDIAKFEQACDLDILTAACLLHDIGREAQAADPAVCHAKAGAALAYDYLLSIGWDEQRARHAADCISTHRFRADDPPVTIEAKILFDADKLDAAGALGIARTLIYQGQMGEPLYIPDADGSPLTETGGPEGSESFFQEYNFKLKNVYDLFYTRRAREIGGKRRRAAEDFYSALHDEITFD